MRILDPTDPDFHENTLHEYLASKTGAEKYNLREDILHCYSDYCNSIHDLATQAEYAKEDAETLLRLLAVIHEKDPKGLNHHDYKYLQEQFDRLPEIFYPGL